jgi:hypothetical protein
MNRLIKLINEMDEHELAMIKRDLEMGSLKKIVDQKIIDKKEEDWNKVCPVCHTPISNGSMTLIFGPPDLRKKASFCAVDCLEYFIDKLKDQRRSHKVEDSQ